nr:pyrimidine/purine nucleotide monophosphate nucleosidase domain-containing protein [Xenorhabdus japonica]
MKDFVEQDRMKLPGGTAYELCYEINRRYLFSSIQ